MTATDTWSVPAVRELKAGTIVNLVRWVADGRGGWTSELLTGQFRRHDKTTFTVTIAGEDQSFSRTQWVLCDP